MEALQATHCRTLVDALQRLRIKSTSICQPTIHPRRKASLLTMWEAKMYLKKRFSRSLANPWLINASKATMVPSLLMARLGLERLSPSKDLQSYTVKTTWWLISSITLMRREVYFQEASSISSIKSIRSSSIITWVLSRATSLLAKALLTELLLLQWSSFMKTVERLNLMLGALTLKSTMSRSLTYLVATAKSS